MKIVLPKKALKKCEKTNANRAVTHTAIALGAGLAMSVIGVVALAAFYCKTLMDVSYIGEDDIYEDR